MAPWRGKIEHLSEATEKKEQALTSTFANLRRCVALFRATLTAWQGIEEAVFDACPCSKAQWLGDMRLHARESVGDDASAAAPTP